MASFSPDKAEDPLTADRNATIVLTELGVNYCHDIVGPLSTCAAITAVFGDLSQDSMSYHYHRFKSALGRAGLQAEIFKAVHLKLEAQYLQKDRERLLGSIIKIGGSGFALGLGISF